MTRVLIAGHDVAEGNWAGPAILCGEMPRALRRECSATLAAPGPAPLGADGFGLATHDVRIPERPVRDVARYLPAGYGATGRGER